MEFNKTSAFRIPEELFNRVKNYPKRKKRRIGKHHSLFAYTAANLNSLAHSSAPAVALAAVQDSPRHSCRSAKSLRRTA